MYFVLAMPPEQLQQHRREEPAPYSYSWNTLPVQTNPTATGLTAGDYTVTITDNRGCTATANVTITQPRSAYSNHNTVNVLCNGNSTGSATAILQEDCTIHLFMEYITVKRFHSDRTCSRLYIVTVTDVNGMFDPANVTITQPALALTAPQHRLMCYVLGNATGTATAIPAGGTGPYSYSWNTVPGQTAATAINLAARRTVYCHCKRCHNCNRQPIVT